MRAPDAKRETLILLAGIVWTAVGTLLIVMACWWMRSIHGRLAILTAVGIAGGVAVYRFGFSRLAAKNLVRIRAQAPEKDRVCVFAFQNRRSYLIIVIMMLMGYGLRHSSLPRAYLIPVYLALGCAMVLSSVHYYYELR